MAVYQEKDKGTWRVVFRYTDFTGERKQTQKRGFKTKREAIAWEHEMMLRKGNKLDMTFESFYEMYSEYKRQRVKESTFETKSHIVRTKILPYFGKRKINEITVTDVIAWQHTAGSNSQSVTLQSSKSSTVCFTDNRSSHQWLSGNAYKKITFDN